LLQEKGLGIKSILFFSASALVILLIFFKNRDKSKFAFEGEFKTTNRKLWISVSISIVLGLAALASAFLNASNVSFLLSLASFAALVFPLRGKTAESQKDRPASVKVYILLGLLLVFLTIFLRTFNLNGVEEGLQNDSAWNGLWAGHILTEKIAYSPLTSDLWAGESTFRYFIAFFVPFLSVITSIKISGAIIGVTTVLLAFFLFKNIFNVRLAFLGALLLSVEQWQLVYSRVGWHAILTPLAQIIMIYGLVYGVKKFSYRGFIFAGLGMALSFNSYYAARISPLIIFIFAFFLIGSIKKYWKGLILTLLTFLVLMIPSFHLAITQPDAYFSKSSSMFIGNEIIKTGSLDPLIKNIQSAFMTIPLRANGDDFFTSNPLLDILSVALIFVGLFLLISKYNRWNLVLILSWILVNFVPGIWSKPNGQRLLGMAVPIALLAALPLEEMFKIVKRKWVPILFSIAIISFIAFQSYQNFVRPGHDPLPGVALEANALGKWTKSKMAVYDVYLPEAYALTYPVKVWTWLDRTKDPLLSQIKFMDIPVNVFTGRISKDKPSIFIFDNSEMDRYAYNFVLENFEVEKTEKITEEVRKVPIFDAVYVKRLKNLEVQGPVAEFTNSKGSFSLPFPVFRIPRTLGEDPLDIKIKGSLRIVQEGTYNFKLICSNPFILSLGGESLKPIERNENNYTFSIMLDAGLVDFELDLEKVLPTASLFLAWQKPDESYKQIFGNDFENTPMLNLSQNIPKSEYK